MSMDILSVNSRKYTQLQITDYEIALELLDGDGSGRTKAYGWGMIRDPQGYICNLYLEFAATNSRNPDFVHLWQTCKSLGKKEFVPIKFIDPVGDVIEQNMYIVIARLKCKRFEMDGKIYTDVIKVSLIAEEGQ